MGRTQLLCVLCLALCCPVEDIWRCAMLCNVLWLETCCIVLCYRRGDGRNGRHHADATHSPSDDGYLVLLVFPSLVFGLSIVCYHLSPYTERST